MHAHRGLDKNSRYLSELTAFSEYQDSEYEELANLQYKQADTAHTRQFLQDLLSFMDRAEANQKVVDKNVVEFYRGITYMRLVLLEERSGNNEASRKYVAAAEDCFKRRQSEDYSEAFLREITSKLDSALP